MKQNSCDPKPSSFAGTVQLVEDYVRAEIAQEKKEKQLFYHTLDHALAVKRRASLIFEGIKFYLAKDYSANELERLQCLLEISAIAHDMVQVFADSSQSNKPRQHLVGISERATADKLIRYIKNLNQELAKDKLDSAILFNDRDIEIIEDAIVATICVRDPQAGQADYSFSPHSIYQPYLYSSQPKVSVVGSILALADLGTLAMDGVEAYIKDGILIFLEDNLDLKNLIVNWNCSRDIELEKFNQFNSVDYHLVKARLINMTRFMVNLAKERYARLDLEISGFTPQIRQILTENIFTYLNSENIEKIENIVPTEETNSLSELISFFRLNINKDF